jgi:hypothetical protein
MQPTETNKARKNNPCNFLGGFELGEPKRVGLITARRKNVVQLIF